MNIQNIDKYGSLWSDWLQQMQAKPNYKIVQNGNLLQFVNPSSDLTKRILTSTEIIMISKKMLKNETLDFSVKNKIVYGIEYIIRKREKNYDDSWFVTKVFAKLKGTGQSIQKEKSAIISYKSAIAAGINNKKFFDIEKEVQRLVAINSKKLPPFVNKNDLNEMIFQCDKNLYLLRLSLAAQGFPTEKVNELEKLLGSINPNLPKINTLIKVFGSEIIGQPLKTMVSNLCDLYLLDQHELDRDCLLFDCDPTEMQAIYVIRMAKTFQTGFSLSVVTAIEKTWKEMVNHKQNLVEERQIEEYRVIFIPDSLTGRVIVIERFLDAGAFKAVFLATPFFKSNTPESRGKMVVLQPLESVKKEVEAAQQKEKEIRKQKAKREVVDRPKAPDVVSTDPEKPLHNQEVLLEEAEGSTVQTHEEDEGSVLIDTDATKGADFQKKLGEELEPSTKSKDLDQGGEDSQKSDEVEGSVVIDLRVEEDLVFQEKLAEGVVSSKKSKGSDKGSTVVQKSDKGEDSVIINSDQASEKQQAKDWGSLSKSAEIPLKETDDREAYEKEAAMCLKVGHLPGIWPTDSVITIKGVKALIQKTAGYKVTPQNSKKPVTAINLAHILKLSQQKQLTTKDQIVFLNMIGGFLKGVQSLHGEEIIHRDLKPENILCGPNGYCGITDFGAACTNNITTPMKDGEQLKPNPEKRLFTGTNYYLAPEVTQWTKKEHGNAWKKIGIQADIWSTGMILWELLSGLEIHQHPAIRFASPLAYSSVGELLNPKTPGNLTFYHKNFPEPTDKNSLIYLIWSCTRANPADRIDIKKLIILYQQWSNRVVEKLQNKKFTYIEEAFHIEMELERTKQASGKVKRLVNKFNS